MADRLVVIAVDNRVVGDVQAVQAIPLQGGWGNGALRGDSRIWGVWASTFVQGTRQQLAALRDSGRCQIYTWDDSTPETHPEFVTRTRQAIDTTTRTR
jgi:hypothetical protein